MSIDNIKQEEKKRLTNTELINLHSNYYNHYDSSSQQIISYLSLFLSAIFVVLGGCVIVITTDIIIIIQSVILCLCGGLSLLLSVKMLKMYTRGYENILNCIAKIVIIEEKLGIDNAEIYHSKYWENDSMVMEHHINFRKQSKTIEEFKTKALSSKACQKRNVKSLSIYLSIFSTAPIVYALIQIILLIICN